VWGNLSTEEGGKGKIPHNKPSKKARAGVHAQQPGAGSLVKVAEEENSTGEGGRPTSHMNCK
jgi:hypothetical protein